MSVERQEEFEGGRKIAQQLRKGRICKGLTMLGCQHEQKMNRGKCRRKRRKTGGRTDHTLVVPSSVPDRNKRQTIVRVSQDKDRASGISEIGSLTLRPVRMSFGLSINRKDLSDDAMECSRLRGLTSKMESGVFEDAS